MFLSPIMCVQCLVIKIQYPYVIVHHISLYQWKKNLHICFSTTIYIFYIASKVTTLKTTVCDDKIRNVFVLVLRNQKVILIISISINSINQYTVDVSSLKHKVTFQTIFTQPFDYSTKEKLLKYFQSIQTDKVSFKESKRLEAKGILRCIFTKGNKSCIGFNIDYTESQA